MADSLLDADFIKRLEYLYVVTRELFTGHDAGERTQRRFGVGMEFADFRPYAPGDDFRYIDWAAFARRDDVVIKLFTEEKSTHLYLVIDASRSMSLGAPSKLLYAKKIAAALAYIGLSNLDSITLSAFDASLRAQDFNGSGRGKTRAILNYLEALQPSGETTSLGETFRRFVQRYPKRGMVILISDFLDRAGYRDALGLLHYHRYDLLAIQVNEREELEPSFLGELELTDSESGERLLVQMTPDLMTAYQERVREHYEELEGLCKTMRRGYVQAVTDLPFDELILETFRSRGLVR